MEKNLKDELFQKRKSKIEKWIACFDTSQENVIKRYRKKFSVDRTQAIKELTSLGVHLTQKQIDYDKQYEKRKKEHFRRKRKQKKLRKHQKQSEELDEFQDDQFYYIAGYISGGVPYGVTWEEMGLDPYEKE